MEEISRFRSVGRRFSYALIGVVTLLLFTFAIAAIFINIRSVQANLEAKLNNTANLAAVSLSTLLWNMDHDSANDVVQALFLDPAIVYARVLVEDQDIANQTRDGYQDQTFEEFEKSAQFLVGTGTVYHSELKEAKLVIGTIQLAVTRAAVRQQIFLNVAGIVALTVLVIAAISLTTLLISRRYVAIPLSELQRSTTLIASGELDTPIDGSSPDEIGLLARDLNGMRESLKGLFEETRDAHEKLEEYGRTLEQRVDERTAELEDATSAAQEALSELKRAQASLVQSEKLSALGQLTAGIAHEIKNPLNFVNNFAEVSGELLGELQEELEPCLDSLEDDVKEDALDLFQTLTGNLVKIKEHGARADRIVKGMLSHAHEGPSNAASVDLNALVEESLNLAYHGMRAEHQEFNVTLERNFDEAAGDVELFPQEFSRVLLNLIGNGFYAVHQRQMHSIDADYKPSLTVSTRALGEEVELRVRDNGTGIPASALEKIFNPFFTTKPVGSGTGLGLSLSYEAVVQLHQGRIDVDTIEGEFTEFIVVLPRKMTLAVGGEA